ncbi:MAG TPA: S41 family peptidase [Gemmatimonadales bacterium]|jgi:carboxyl-terminal processing protease|nr:S41 family peptidase [Gemmatimonadales bacterium]
MKQRWGVIALVAITSFLSGGWLLQRGGGPGDLYRSARLFEDVLSHISAYYVDSIPQAELYQRATTGLLEQLHDPYSTLLQGDDYRQLTETTTGNYGGLGIQIDVRDGWITVVAPLPETPAERAGIETGDQIIAVDGKSTEGWNNDQAVKALRGTPGTEVELQIRRAGFTKPVTYRLTRAQIHIRSVPPGTLFPGGVGYVSLNPVAENSAQELRNEIKALLGKGMKTLVLDLRNNPGGLLDQGVRVADLFLDRGAEIVSTRGRTRESTKRFLDEAKQEWPNLPIVVLVNEGTASAAEIISGALQDHDRAVVVGVPTFGKGLVQTLFQFSDNTALKLTTGRWYTPSGRTIQRTARSEEDQARQALVEAEGAPDSSATADTARPVFRTDLGRVVRGGGGIVPDLIVRPDSLTDGERQFAAALGAKFAEYRDVLTSYALQLKNDKAITSEDFRVTPAMRAEVLRRLRAKGVELSDETFAKGASLVDQQLGYEIARYLFGRPSEFRRRARDDRQMQAALGLLRRAQNPKDLLALAAAAAPTVGRY